MQSLAAELARRRLRLKDYFQDYDRLRTGTVSVDQLRRVLATADVLKGISEDALRDMNTTYSTGDKFAYAAFVRDLDDLETKAVNSGTLTRVGRAPDAESVAYGAFSLCAQQKAAGGVDVRQSFHPFDKHNNGKVTTSQFQRSFPFKLDATQFQAVLDRYAADGKADYFAFDADLRAFIAQTSEQRAEADWRDTTVGASGVMESPLRNARSAPSNNSVEVTLSELKYHLSKEHINVLDYFRDFDRLRSGVVSAGQFSSAIGRIILRAYRVSQEALDRLVQHYGVADSRGERVSYSRFLRDLEAAPMGGPRGAIVDDVDSQRVQAVLEKVRTAIRTRRVNLKPTFQDYDRANKGVYLTLTCTRKRFERALAVNNITLAVAELDLLEHAYSVNRTGEGDTDAFNYVAFCRDVDVPEGAVESPSVAKAAPSVGRGTFNAVTGTTLVKKEPTLDSVLDVAMLQIAARSIRLQEFVRDYDPLRSGSVTKDKLATAISMSGLRLEPDQVQLLLKTYEVAPGADRVAYPRLLAALDCDAQGDTNRSVLRVDEARARVTAEVQAATEAMHSEQLDVILQRVRDDVRARQILLPPFFQDYDKHHRGIITAAQFERVLCRHRLPVSPGDMTVLKQYFADPADPSSVRCRDFIAAVDAAEASRLPKHLRETSAAAGGDSSTAPTAAVTASAAATPDLGAVMAKVARVVLARSVRVSELFRDADPLRKGFCHQGKFGSALSALGVGLTDAELDTLFVAYDDPRNNKCVNYARFCKAIDAVESQRAMGSAELTVAGGATLRAAPPQASISAVEDAVGSDPFLQKVLANVRSMVNARRMNIRSTVQDFDKLRKGRIPSSQFFSALSANGITFNALETSKLLELFGENGMVNYGVFCGLVEQ